eukprot:1633984-Pleurochrysis_carterae.AAC.1
MPRTSNAWIIDEIVAFVAFDVARASTASWRSSSRPLPAQEAVYVRRAARLAIVSRIVFISLRSTASIISGANIKRLHSSGVSGGGRGTPEAVNETGADVAVAEGAAPAPESACERVCGPAVPAAA